MRPPHVILCSSILQTITGVSIAEANTTAFANATTSAICSTTGAARQSVHIDSITAAGRRRTLLQGGGVVVRYTITAVNGNAAALRTMISEAITLGTFTAALQSNGYTAATASTMPVIVDYSPTQSPTPAVKSSSTRNVTIIIAVVSVVGSIAIGLMLFLHFKVWNERLRLMKISPRPAVIEKNIDEVSLRVSELDSIPDGVSEDGPANDIYHAVI